MKTWADIEAASLNNPFFQTAVSAVATGRVTREQALIAVSLGLADALSEVQRLVMEFGARSPRPPLTVKK